MTVMDLDSLVEARISNGLAMTRADLYCMAF